MLDLASTKGLLDWAQAGAIDFSRLCRQHWHGGAGGSSLNPFQASETCFVLETHGCTSSVPTWHTSYCLWLLNIAWWGIKRNRSCFAGWRMATLSWWAICFEVLRAILKKLGTLVGGFWAQRHLFSFWVVCVLWRPFLASISGRRLLPVIGVKPKIASFLTSIFGSKCGAQVCCFLHMWQVIPT